jgi:thiopurine S-methyltransferase
VADVWIERWEQGRIGWHEPGGNSKLKTHWPKLAAGSRVLVPFCGKSPDMLWLSERGLEVVGIELSQIAVKSFFSEHELDFEQQQVGELSCYRAPGQAITIFCGDYFAFESEPFDALYDRGALIALPAELRSGYVKHTKSLLKDDAYRLIITLEYEQLAANGPPFAVMADEITSYWSDLQILSQNNDIENCPPKFSAAGLTEVIETAWASPL